MEGLAAALQALGPGSSPAPASSWPASLEGLDSPGLYAWWVDGTGAAHLSTGLGIALPAGLVYAGQAGAASSAAGLPSAATLRSRVGGNHLGGNVRGSTLRRTLASVLLAPLALRFAGPQRLEADSEARLTAWMRRRLALAVHPVESGEGLGQLEGAVVAELRPPLNIEHTADGSLRRRLQELRRVVRHGIDDMWTPPDPGLADWRQILGEYGQDFDGCRYAKLVLRRECPEVAEDVLRRLGAGEQAQPSFGELRCALFWLQRWVHNAEQSPGCEPGEELVADVHRLYRTILNSWDLTWGVAT
jgi:hypothetical protein